LVRSLILFPSQCDPVVRVHGCLPGDVPDATAHGGGPHGILIGIVVDDRELRRWPGILNDDRFMFRQCRFSPDASVGLISLSVGIHLAIDLR
jgi:hypothetical protein